MRTPRLPCGRFSQTPRPFATMCCALAPLHRQSRIGNRAGFPGSMLLTPTLPSVGKLRVASVRSVSNILHASWPARSVMVKLTVSSYRSTLSRAPHSTVWQGTCFCVSKFRTSIGLSPRSSARVMCCSSIRAIFERPVAISMSFSNAYCRRCRRAPSCIFTIFFSRSAIPLPGRADSTTSRGRWRRYYKKAGRKSCSCRLRWCANCWTRSMVLAWTGCLSCPARSNRASGFISADQGLGRFRHLARAINRGVIDLNERGFPIGDQ